MLSYKRYTPNASEMGAKLSSAEGEMARLSEELSNVEAKLLSMVHTISILCTLDTIDSMNKFLVHKYNPVLSEQASLISQIAAQSEMIEHMKQAMLEPGYIADHETHVARRVKKARRDADMDADAALIESVEQAMNEGEIRGKIKRVFVYPSDLTEKPLTINEGDVAGIQICQEGGRSFAINWATPCVVMKRVEGRDNGIRYVVCSFDQYKDCLGCHIVDKDGIHGPPLSGLVA